MTSPSSKTHAQTQLNDNELNAVIGGHPHVTQDVEHYRGKPIIYSLGNFVFDGFTSTDNNTGWVLRMEFDRQGARNWRIDSAHIDKIGIPYPAKVVNKSDSSKCWTRGDAESVACATP